MINLGDSANMTIFKNEIEQLVNNDYLPGANYWSSNRYIKPYKDTGMFWNGVLSVVKMPLLNTVLAFEYALLSIWAIVRAIGNLLIIKPSYAMDAAYDVSTYATLSIALAIMAPIHALTYSVEILTRLVTSWFSEKATDNATNDASPNLTYEARFFNTYHLFNQFLPSATYIEENKFIDPHENVLSFLYSAAFPFILMGFNGFYALTEALLLMINATECLTNLLIAKPQEALVNVQDMGIDLSLSISLALMTPINGMVGAIAFITRLGSTWISACNNANVDSDEKAVTLSDRFALF